MSTRPVLVAGNWKMNLLSAQARELAAATARAAAEFAAADVAVFPAFTLLPAAAIGLVGSRVILGAQCCHEAPSGAHTGEVSTAMLIDAGCTSVLAGHSERRAAGASDEQVAARARAGLDSGLQVIVCVGETLDEREAGETEAVLSRQFGAVAERIAEADLALLDVAYEPVWAIGTGRTATPEIAAAAHRCLRDRLVEKFGEAGRAPRILYGGSVKPGNVADLLAADEVRGVLVGGASLDGASFRALVEAGAAASA